MQYEVNLRLTGVQAKIVERSLDVYTRLGMGHLEIVADALNDLSPEKCRGDNYIDTLHMMREIKTRILGHPPNGHNSIAGPEVHDDAKIAYDLQKVVQKVVAEVEHYREGSLWHYGVTRKLGSEPVAVAIAMERGG